MALKFTDPAEEYPFVFLVSQNIGQLIPVLVTDTPTYTLSIVWKTYKIVDGKMVFNPTSQSTYDTDDYMAIASLLATAGDTSHINTLTAQVISIQKIIQGETGKEMEII